MEAIANFSHPQCLGGSKPRRGGLFIANERPTIILFVFRRRGLFREDASQYVGVPPRFRHWNCSLRRAAEKQKEKRRLAFYPINRPPLRGLGAPADHSNPYMIR